MNKKESTYKAAFYSMLGILITLIVAVIMEHFKLNQI